MSAWAAPGSMRTGALPGVMLPVPTEWATAQSSMSRVAGKQSSMKAWSVASAGAEASVRLNSLMKASPGRQE